ncbi:MAG: hypothetical protein IPK76_12270 [Lewinellaceae bacterium]|nr:hypothetical protein [Lewinellaceae bacterium]
MTNLPFLHGFKVAMRQWRIAAIVYAIQLGLALTLGMQVYEVLEASIGRSLEINKLLSHYDHTVLTDFLKVHGASITPLVGQLRWLLLVWLIFSVFIDAGLLYCAARPEQASGRFFWQGGAVYFFPFLKIGLFFLALALVWTALIWIPTAVLLEPSLEYFSTEQYPVWLVLLLMVVWLLGLAVLFVWSVASRLQHLSTGMSVAGSLADGWRVFRSRKAHLLGLLTGFVALQMLLVVLYFTLEGYSGMTSVPLIPVFFAVQQAFVFFRIQIRQMMYAAIAETTKGRRPPLPV